MWFNRVRIPINTNFFGAKRMMIHHITNNEPIIINKDIRPCFTCHNYESISEKCGKFAEKNIVTNTKKNISAEMCRYDENKCGKEGSLHNQMTDREVSNREFYNNSFYYTYIPAICITPSICYLIMYNTI